MPSISLNEEVLRTDFLQVSFSNTTNFQLSYIKPLSPFWNITFWFFFKELHPVPPQSQSLSLYKGQEN